jgi:hypothetical protein
MVAARRLNAANFPLVNPLLDRRETDAKLQSCFARSFSNPPLSSFECGMPEFFAIWKGILPSRPVSVNQVGAEDGAGRAVFERRPEHNRT